MRISDWSSDVCSSDLAVGVLHQKLAPAHHAEAGTYLVAELPLDVVERARQVAIASGGIAEDRGDHFLCRRALQHLPLVAVLEAEHFRAIGVIAPAFAPEIGGLDRRHQQFDRARAVLFLPDRKSTRLNSSH